MGNKYRVWDRASFKMLYGREAETFSYIQMRCGIPIDFMWYTGMRDKKRKDIYQGDIIRDDSGKQWQIIGQMGGVGNWYAINYKAKAWAKSKENVIVLPLELWKNAEVIGNIFEEIRGCQGCAFFLDEAVQQGQPWCDAPQLPNFDGAMCSMWKAIT
jgi:hypothetical protein